MESSLPSAAALESQKDLRLILFRLGDSYFVLPIGIVREVVHANDKMSPVQDRVGCLLGTLAYRSEAIPVYDILQAVGLPSETEGIVKKVIVLDVENQLVAIKVDEVSDIVKHNEIVSHSPLVNLDFDQQRTIVGILELKTRKATALLINAKNLMEALQGAGHKCVETVSETLIDTSTATSQRALALRFETGGAEWCLPIHMVERILPPLKLNRFPGMPDYVLGIRQIEGEVVPIIDFHRRVSGDNQGHELKRILVVKHDGETIGIGVDKVRDILDLSVLHEAPCEDGLLRKFCDTTFSDSNGVKIHMARLELVSKIGDG